MNVCVHLDATQSLRKLDHDDAVTLTLELYKVLLVILRCCPSFDVGLWSCDVGL